MFDFAVSCILSAAGTIERKVKDIENVELKPSRC